MSKTSSVVAIWIAALSLFSIAGPRLCADDIVAHPSKLKFDEVQFTAPKRADHRHEIAGGVVAYVVEDRSLPLVDISVLVRTGSYLDPKGKEGLAEIVGELLRSGGTSKLSPNEFDEEIDFLAAQVSSSIGDERGSASLNCLTKDVDRVLELFFDMLRRPRFDSARFDTLGEVIEGNGFRVLDTRTDGTDAAVAQANAEDALVAHPGLDAMVGLFNSNPPACMQAVEGAGRLGEVVIAGFDENELTLQGIADGHIVGTVSQDPYQYGYLSVKLLHSLSTGEGEVPAETWVPTELAVVTADNVDEFRAELARQLEAGQ